MDNLNLNLKDLELSKEDSRDIIDILAKKRNIKNYKRKSDDKLLQTIKENETPKKQPKNKKRIDSIREDFKKLSYKLSKSELKEIKNNLYSIEKTKQFDSKKTNKRLNELEKKLIELKKYHNHDDEEYRGIKDIKDLFKLSINEDYYKPVLSKSGYNENYLQYVSNETALNILYVPHNTKKINIAYKSKHNLTREKQIILLMITNGEKWHYLVVKNLSGLLRGITSNHNADSYCLNGFCSYSTKNKLEKHKKYVKIMIIVM